MADRIMVEKIFHAGKDAALGNELQDLVNKLGDRIDQSRPHSDPEVDAALDELADLINKFNDVLFEVG